ncbi:helix-turn-helix transcriptional regulator [Sphingopyxis yananensis]|uniref:helix-turn-helix transcriptional regulator n=1 Tax=Sphingopyxis yananensis TaxID=2886687 RepID=UPI001D0F8DC0|nr:helix-turn-helix transcriptional regulator [Sphingopyxis yananensis]MCC2603697.1 helix-turn-helix transcriptional regulator [Sphingopyxis yananensis]
MIRPNDSNLLLALHDGASDEPYWGGFLDMLRERTKTARTSIVLRHEAEGQAVYFFSGQHPPPDQQSISRDKFSRAPAPYQNMRDGRVYALEELLDLANADHRAIYGEIILPWGLPESRTMRVTVEGGLTLWLGCAGGPGIGWSAISALMASLAPHLRVAFRNFSALEMANMRVHVSSEAFERRDFGWVTLDARCRMVDASPHIEDLLRRCHTLQRDRYGRLTPRSPAIDRELTALIKSYAELGHGPAKAIRLSSDPQMEMLVRPMKDGALSTASSPVAIAYLSGDHWSHADRCDQLVDLFGLLPSEARLAWALGRGLSISEAAEELGLQVETARYYSKKIYAKTGARGQAELVRNILMSVLGMG